MEISTLRQSQMIAGVAGIVLLISLFLDWGLGLTAWDLFSVMDIIMLLIAVAAIAYAALPAAGSADALPHSSGWILLMLGVGVVGFVLGFDLENSFAGFGAWLALVASAALAYAAYTDVRGGPLAAPMGTWRGVGRRPPAGTPTGPAGTPSATATRPAEPAADQPAGASAPAVPPSAGTPTRRRRPPLSGGTGASGGGSTPPRGTP